MKGAFIARRTTTAPPQPDKNVGRTVRAFAPLGWESMQYDDFVALPTGGRTTVRPYSASIAVSKICHGQRGDTHRNKAINRGGENLGVRYVMFA